MKSVSEMAETNDTHELPRITVVRSALVSNSTTVHPNPPPIIHTVKHQTISCLTHLAHHPIEA